MIDRLHRLYILDGSPSVYANLAREWERRDMRWCGGWKGPSCKISLINLASELRLTIYETDEVAPCLVSIDMFGRRDVSVVGYVHCDPEGNWCVSTTRPEIARMMAHRTDCVDPQFRAIGETYGVTHPWLGNVCA